MDKETRQIEIQRLIDGRMPQSERVALLECLDDDPDGWRELALGFVEEQVLRSELSTLATRNDVDKSLPRVTLHRARTGLWFSATAVVVALLVGGVAGRWLSSQEDSSDMDSGEVAEEPSSTGAQSQADDDYYVLLKPAIASPGEESSWDHVAASLRQPIFGDQTRETIRQHGYEVDEEPVLYVIEDREGGHYIIPQRHITFVSHQN